ncbi:hypothetical protein L3Y34_013258 [Caenorhabditis briggsae]|uniref:MEIS N-terminal domain-containing protein n=1 Tax=Caenorhabditis briggsae TaxID=6238 RepID=A0AAE9CXE8_CAEBR|nr:hypothetical protein L3Y34_013258 [Caenorhabditis briggsae]
MGCGKLFKSLGEAGVQLSPTKDEIDELMTTAILALRTCLVEMEKVFNLSENFKAKYMTILRRTVCHEALVGTSGDSDDELSDTPGLSLLALSGPELQAAQAKAMETAISALQSGGASNLPVQFPPQSLTMTQIERNFEFLRRCGFPTPQLPPDFFKQFANKSPEKSEEEKSQRPLRSSKSPSSPD